MAITWGDITLKILFGTWQPGIHPNVMTEIPLLPDANNMSAVSSVIQQSGKLRRRIQGKLFVTSMTAYDAFVASYLAGTTATLNDGDSINGTYMIESVGAAEYRHNNAVFFDITFVEV